MSFERAIKNRKQELLILQKALRKAKKKNTGQIQDIESRVKFLKKTILDLKNRRR